MVSQLRVACRLLSGIMVRKKSADFFWKASVYCDVISRMGLGGSVRLWMAIVPDAAPVRNIAKWVAIRNKCALLRV